MNSKNKNHFDKIYHCARKSIRKKIYPMIGLFGLTRHDLPDIEQEIMLAIFKKLKRYDPARSGIKTFILQIIESKLADIINHRMAARRDWRQCCVSLNEIIMTDAGPMERIELLEYENIIDQRLCIDIEAVIEKLPDDLKELCALLKYYNRREALGKYGRSKTVFYKKIEKLYRIFERASLKKKFR